MNLNNTNSGVPRHDLLADDLLSEYERECYKLEFSEAAHAFELGIPLSIYQDRLTVGRMNRLKKNGKLTNFNLGTAWELSGDFMVVGDVHVPYTDWGFAQRVGMVAKKQFRAKKNRRLIIGGDFFNFDAFSSYTAMVSTPSWREERDAAKAVMDEWLEVFSEIYYIMGNHDRRIQKFTLGAFDENDLLSLIGVSRERVFMSGFGYCEVDCHGQKYRITHPKNYSVQQLNVADTLAQKHQCHILSFHEHHLALGWDRYKNNLVINGGWLGDESQLAYVSLDDSKSPRMARGFAMLKDGSPYLFGEAPFTDWSRYGL